MPSPFDPSSPELTTEEIVLHKARVAAQTRISGAAMRDALTAETIVDYATQDLVIRLSSFVMRQDLHHGHDSKMFAYPASWWDALKEDLSKWAHLCRKERPWHRLVGWWLRRHPIRQHFELVHMDASSFATFPDSSYVWPKELGQVRLHRIVDLYTETERRERLEREGLEYE